MIDHIHEILRYIHPATYIRSQEKDEVIDFLKHSFVSFKVFGNDYRPLDDAITIFKQRALQCIMASIPKLDINSVIVVNFGSKIEYVY